jgi:hypothetical protein
MSAEMFAHMMRNSQRDSALVANAPRQEVMDSVVTEPSKGNDQVLDIISELLKRRQ